MDKNEEQTMDVARQAYNQGNYQKAREIWQVKADKGNPEAQSWLGSLYANGDGVEVNDANALAWYEKAAEQGHPMAQANVGAMYYMGQGTEKNIEKAIRFAVHLILLALNGYIFYMAIVVAGMLGAFQRNSK